MPCSGCTKLCVNAAGSVSQVSAGLAQNKLPREQPAEPDKQPVPFTPRLLCGQ